MLPCDALKQSPPSPDLLEVCMPEAEGSIRRLSERACMISFCLKEALPNRAVQNFVCICLQRGNERASGARSKLVCVDN